MKKTIIASALSIVLITGCASNASLSEQEIMNQYPAVQEASSLMKKAKEENLSLYSPEQVKAANEALDNALKQAKAGKADAATSAKEAVARFNAAAKQADEAKYTLEEVFVARNKALNANADSLAPEKFEDAEKQLKKMLALLEVGEDEKATRDITQLTSQYLAVELAALKTNMLSIADRTIKQAVKQDLDDVSPILIAQAKDEYKLALDTLEANRNDTEKANVHSNKAIWLVKRAEGVAEINRYFENADFSEEQKILWYQEQLSSAVSPVMGELQFNQPNKELITDIRGILSQEVEENRELNLSITSLKSQLASAQSNAKQREDALVTDKNQAVLAAQLQLEKQEQAKRQDDARFNGVQSLFKEEEATVYRQRDNVLIRAQGFSFKPGSSEIDSSNFTLLNKIIDAVGRFPNAKIVVSGHTDITGSAELNLQLSKDRAKTVANFMEQVGNISADRLSSEGFGKEKPVASNESVEGRAENRRVEILIKNS